MSTCEFVVLERDRVTLDFELCFGRFYWVEEWIHVKLLSSDSETFGLLTGSLLVERLKKRAV